MDRYGYIALYQGKRAEIYAASSYEAQQKAMVKFNPPKSKRHLVTVHLAEINEEIVTQVITA